MAIPMRGLIEGFYGPPWTWDARLEVIGFCAARGMTHYLYAPKDDPKHRDRWRDPYDDDELAGFERLVTESPDGFEIGFAISPGLSIDYDSADDRAALAAKCEQVAARGVRVLCLALDDIPFRAGLGEQHGSLTTWMRDEFDGRAEVVLVPTEYVGQRRTPYLDALATGVPDDVLIGWTGDAVVNDGITAQHARDRATTLGGRAPLLWDNHPVNDGPMGDQLFIGPLRGREPALLDELGGYLANVGLQPTANKLPLSSIAAWLRRDDPERAWRADADTLGWRTFAEACDGEVPRALAADVIAGGDTSAARDWFGSASEPSAPGLEEECEAWLTQVRREARVALAALDLLDLGPTTGDLEAMGATLGLLTRWKRLQSAPVQVMGPRMGIRPGIGQAADGTWIVLGSSLVSGVNAVDALCRFAFDQATDPARLERKL
jgi:hyaluronoglucosaminidase